MHLFTWCQSLAEWERFNTNWFYQRYKGNRHTLWRWLMKHLQDPSKYSFCIGTGGMLNKPPQMLKKALIHQGKSSVFTYWCGRNAKEARPDLFTVTGLFKLALFSGAMSHRCLINRTHAIHAMHMHAIA